MSRRSIISLAASVIVGSVCVATISTDASAYYRRGVGVYHGGVYRGGVYRGGGAYRGAYYRGGYYRGVRPGVAVGAAVGAAVSALPLPEHITHRAADTIPTARVTNWATSVPPPNG